ncbi:hypothetical protein GCM10023334_115970 [Nonomuraea thailandensis]
MVAWLGFEGSFHFDHLLTADGAHQIYGVCSGGGPPELALEDEERRGERWREAAAACADAHLTRPRGSGWWSSLDAGHEQGDVVLGR